MENYNQRLVEVDEVLNHLSPEDLAKIPEDIKQLIKNNKDTEYTWKFDETKDLKDQGLSRDTIAFLAYLNMEYLLNEKQKEGMQKIHRANEMKLEEEKAKKYDLNDIFKKSVKEQKIPINEEIIIYKENIFSKFFKKIKSFFSFKK